MQEINLLQNKVKDKSLQFERSNRFIVILAVLILILEVSATVGLWVLTKATNNSIKNTQDENQAIQKNIDSHQKELSKAEGLQAQLKNVNTLLTSHIYWSNFMSTLEKLTPVKVQYTAIDGSASDGKMHIEGTADSYTDVGRLILSMSTSKAFKSTRLTSITPGSESKFNYSYSLDVVVDRTIFSKQ